MFSSLVCPLKRERFEGIESQLYTGIQYLLDFTRSVRNAPTKTDLLQSLLQTVIKHIHMAEENSRAIHDAIDSDIGTFLRKRKLDEEIIMDLEIKLRVAEDRLKRNKEEIEVKQRQVSESIESFFIKKADYEVKQMNSKIVKRSVNLFTGLLVASAVLTGGATIGLAWVGGATGTCILMNAASELQNAKEKMVKCETELEDYRMELSKLTIECKTMQYDLMCCRKEKTTQNEKYEQNLKMLKTATELLEWLFKFRFKIIVAQGKIDVLNQERKEIICQSDMKCLLLDLAEHLFQDSFAFLNDNIKAMCMLFKDEIDCFSIDDDLEYKCLLESYI